MCKGTLARDLARHTYGPGVYEMARGRGAWSGDKVRSSGHPGTMDCCVPGTGTVRHDGVPILVHHSWGRTRGTPWDHGFGSGVKFEVDGV